MTLWRYFSLAGSIHKMIPVYQSSIHSYRSQANLFELFKSWLMTYKVKLIQYSCEGYIKIVSLEINPMGFYIEIHSPSVE